MIKYRLLKRDANAAHQPPARDGARERTRRHELAMSRAHQVNATRRERIRATQCKWCEQSIPTGKRKDAETCSKRCRQAFNRFTSRGAGQTRRKPSTVATPDASTSLDRRFTWARIHERRAGRPLHGAMATKGGAVVSEPQMIRLYSYRDEPSHFGPAHPLYRTTTPNGNCRLCGRPIRYGFEVCADGEEICAAAGVYA